ncbi:hypothetical protein [Candidatus Nitrospira bockiana]
MKIRGHTTTLLAVPIVLAAMTLPGGTDDLYAQAPGMGAARQRLEITIKDRQHGYETAGFTMPSHETTIVIRNEDNVTHGFASTLFKDVDVRMEGGTEVRGKHVRSFHVDPGKIMTLRFATAPSKFDPATGVAESVRHAIWCDIHPEVKGEVYVIETRGEIGGG